MKKNTNTTTEATTVPSVTASEVTAAAAAAMIDATTSEATTSTPAISNINEAIKYAVSIGDPEKIKSEYIASMIKAGYSIDIIVKENKEFDTLVAEVKAEAEEKARKESEAKAKEEAIKKYQNLNTADKIMLKVAKGIIDFTDDEIASDIYRMIIENSSTIKVAAFIGKNQSNEKSLKVIKYIYDSVKDEKELVRFSATFTKVVKELLEN